MTQQNDSDKTANGRQHEPEPSREATVCPNCGGAATGPGFFFAGDNTICNEPTHAGSTADGATTATVSRCGNCGHPLHDRLCEAWVPIAGGGVVCGCTVCFLDTASATAFVPEFAAMDKEFAAREADAWGWDGCEAEDVLHYARAYRAMLHAGETRCDPAGEVQRMASLEEQVRGLESRLAAAPQSAGDTEALRPVVAYLIRAVIGADCKEAMEYGAACTCGLTDARTAAAPLRQALQPTRKPIRAAHPTEG